MIDLYSSGSAGSTIDSAAAAFYTPNFSETSTPSSSGSSWDSSLLSGVLQQAMATGNMYLSKRLDIDMATRIAGMQPTVYRGDLTTQAAAAVGGVRLGDLLPLLLIGGVAYLLLGK